LLKYKRLKPSKRSKINKIKGKQMIKKQTFRREKTISLFIFVTLIAVLAVYTALADVSTAFYPTADGLAQWIPSTGTSHFATVDETTCNGNTDYNYTNTVGYRDSYQLSLSAIPNGSRITAIEITPCASKNKTQNGSVVMNLFYRNNGVSSSDAGNYSLSNTVPTVLTATTFSNLSIYKIATTNLQVGAVYTSGSRGLKLSNISAKITYFPLAAPSNLSVTNQAATEIDLQWQDNTQAEDGYNVERSLNGYIWTNIATTTANVITYNDTGLTSDLTYYYRVRAFNSVASTGYTSAVHGITYQNIPLAPTNLTGQASSTIAVLNWTDNSSNEDTFRVEQSLDNINFSEIGSTNLNIHNYYVYSLTPGTYYFRVRSRNIIGDSDYTNTATVIMP
jgi:hypothetical protein